MTNKITSLAEYFQKYKESVADPEGFWAGIAESHYWHKKWDQVLDWRFEGKDAPLIKWFINGKLKITENIFERNMFMRKDRRHPFNRFCRILCSFSGRQDHRCFMQYCNYN